ncbi:enoyl-CoA hydratase/isomerase family protein [Phenylobacterium sp. LjRoot225]|uniref:enoyl-CoA hydratase/isomerase family protein n=1 Tax=Phenylobacterium sp. LjRoot225 TaxID=3342285 RepID=UPI003ECCDE44
MSEVYEDLLVERSGPVGWIRINRPDRRNALRPQTLAEICRAVDGLSADPAVRAMVLAGEGKHFSAGAEFSFLEGLKTTPAPQVKSDIYAHFQGAARRLHHCPKPTIAAVSGAAITVACELALTCDFRLVAPTAEFHESWIKLGLIPPLGGLFLLPRLVGAGRAAEIVLAGRPIGAEEAVRIGLASELVDADRLHERTQAFAAQLAALPPLAYAAAKEGLRRGAESSMEKEWATNVLAQAMLLGTQDFAEGLAAVVEKRPGVFVGA